jgi:hypothetical protein
MRTVLYITSKITLCTQLCTFFQIYVARTFGLFNCQTTTILHGLLVNVKRLAAFVVVSENPLDFLTSNRTVRALYRYEKKGQVLPG